MSELQLDHDFFMRKALALAEQALSEDEIPIGALIVHNNIILGKGYNQTERLMDVTAHAEMLAITAATNQLQAKYLNDCTLYVTIQPCVMCAGAIHHARIGTVIYGAYEPKTGCTMHLSTTFLEQKTKWIGGIMESDCTQILQQFFQSKR